MNVFQASILHYKAILCRGHYVLIRCVFICIMPQVQDRSPDLLTCSSVHYDCAMTTPTGGQSIYINKTPLHLSFSYLSCHQKWLPKRYGIHEDSTYILHYIPLEFILKITSWQLDSDMSCIRQLVNATYECSVCVCVTHVVYLMKLENFFYPSLFHRKNHQE